MLCAEEPSEKQLSNGNINSKKSRLSKKPAATKETRLERNKNLPKNDLTCTRHYRNILDLIKFKDTQEKVIESLLAGHDTFVIMPTGGGKSLCYQLPAMISEGVAIIVSPLIALDEKPG